MADGASFSIDGAKLARDGDQLVRRYLTAGTKAVADTTKALERKLEAATQAAVPGRLWRAWQSKVYPESGPARDPVGSVFVGGKTRSQGAVQFWTRPGEIRGKSGQYLAIPTPAAGPRGRKRDLSPGEWEQAHGVRLRFVYRVGRPALLVVDGARLTRSGRGSVGRGRTLNSARRAIGGTGNTTIVIFVLLPLVKFRNALAVEPIVMASERELVTTFLAEAGRVR